MEVTPPEVAVTVAVPTATAVATPVDEMVATELGVELQVAMAVTLAVEPSWYVAVAVYCTVVGPRERLRVCVSG